MTPAQHQETVDVAKVVVNEYFDYYLTEVFPQQMDRLFKNHNQDAEAHEPILEPLLRMKKKVDRTFWMITGGVAVVSVLGTLLVENWTAVAKVLFAA